MRLLVTLATVCGFAIGCGGATPAPTPVPYPTTRPAPTATNQGSTGDFWHLTTRITVVDGPPNCFHDGFTVGQSQDWTMAVDRSGSSVTFDYDVHNRPTDDIIESGTVNGEAFTASSTTEQISFPSCPDGTVLSGTFRGSVTGQFSADGTHLDAQEAWVYAFGTGTVTVHKSWSADAMR
jgi:hypothetical protein